MRIQLRACLHDNEIRPENSFDQVKLIEPLNNAILRRACLVTRRRIVILEAIRRLIAHFSILQRPRAIIIPL